jgi:decaprenylphospho-beta-D-erythro-pentofuranosid-2-ulose 2-reductase
MKAAAKRVVILGATSGIAEAAARIWADRGARFVLVGRRPDRLSAVAADLKARGAAQAEEIVADCAEVDAAATLKGIVETLGGIDIVLLAYAVKGNQETCERDPMATADVLRANFTSGAAWCLGAASILEAQGSGALLVIGSVAGDRGRASNYVYGASKAGLGVLVEGISHRLGRIGGARAVLIKPGFTDTPMNAAIMKKGPLWSKPEAVAKVIVAAAERGPPIVYAPWFWRVIMLIVRGLPVLVFHRTNF